MACLKLVRRTERNIGLTVLCIGICVQYAATATRMGITESPMNWWDARNSCHRVYEGDLLVSETGTASVRLHPGRYYWVGAMKYPTWRWTHDHSLLYRYVGYRPFFADDVMSPVTVNVNSVYECNSHCTQHHLMGLSGNKCYCLDNDTYIPVKKPLHALQACAGNLDEKCGNSLGMSIYQLDGIMFDPSTREPCAYVAKDETGSTLKMGTAECVWDQKYYACSVEGTSRKYCDHYQYYPQTCEGNVCISCNRKSWWTANYICNLAKANGDNEHLKKAMTEGQEYWIGLHRYIKESWLNGNGVLKPRYGTYSHSGPMCRVLIAWNMYGGILEWEPCTYNFYGICKGGSSTSTSPATITSKTYSGVSWTPMRNISKFHVEDNKKITSSDNSQLKGIYIGAGIGCGLLILVVFILIVLLRQGRVCLKKLKDGQVHYNVAAENLTYLGSSAENASIVTPVNGHSRTIHNSDLPESIQNGCDSNRNSAVVSADLHVYNRILHQNGQSNRNANTSEEVIEDGGDYNSQRKRGSVEDTKNCYHHIGYTEDNYDVLDFNPQKHTKDDTYNHLSDPERQKNSVIDNAGCLEYQQELDKTSYSLTEEDIDYNNVRYSTKNVDYYNVGFSIDGPLGEKSAEQKEEGNVYSLAGHIS